MTSIQHRIYSLPIEFTEKLIIVLDASESAVLSRDRQLEYCHTLLSQLPADLPVNIYFLGNSTSHPSKLLLNNGMRQFENNSRRCSLLNPILSNLDSTTVKLVVILGAGEVFDLEDYIDTPWAKKFLLVNINDSLQSNINPKLSELNNPDPNELYQHLHSPLVSIKFSGDGFLPLMWDNQEYQRNWDAANGKYVLYADRLTKPAVNLHLLICENAKLIITRQYGNGQIATESVTPSLSITAKHNGYLNEAEVACFNQAQQGLKYICPRCKKEHEASVIYCNSNPEDILQPLIYPSITGYKGIVRFCPDANGSVAYFLHGEAFPLTSNNKILWYQGSGRAKWMRFSATWLNDTLSQPKPYELLEGGYVLCV